MTKQIEKQTSTIQFLCQALASLLATRHLVLEGIRLKKLLPKELEAITDVGYRLAKELEPDFYFGCAGLLMFHAFGKEGKIRELANKTLSDMVQADLDQQNDKS